MRKLLIFVMALMVLATFSVVSFAQQKAFGAEAHLYLKMTGKVTKVNEKAKTFTVMAKGKKEFNFTTAKLKSLPKVGEIIDITYTENPNGPAEATNLNSSKSNSY